MTKPISRRQFKRNLMWLAWRKCKFTARMRRYDSAPGCLVQRAIGMRRIMTYGLAYTEGELARLVTGSSAREIKHLTRASDHGTRADRIKAAREFKP